MNKELTPSPTHCFTELRDFLFKNRTNYQEAYNNFQWPELPYFNWALDYFDPMAETNHDKTALWIVGENHEEKYTFGDMSQRSNQVANFLTAQGVKPFDRIMLMLPNHVALWECMLAAIKMRAIVVPSSTALSEEDIAYRLKQADIKYVITLSSETTKLDKLRKTKTILFGGIVIGDASPGWTPYDLSKKSSEEFSPTCQTKKDDPLLYYFTSGTTSNPKLVIHTHQSYSIGHLSTVYWLGLQPDSVHQTVATPGWAKWAWAFFTTWGASACAFVYAYQRFDPEQFLNILMQYPITSLCAPPTVWRALRNFDLKNYKPTHLKEITSAGEPLNPEIIVTVKEAWGETIREGYGQTETTAIVGFSPGQPIIPGAMGYVLPGYKVTLLNEQGQEANEGELVINMQPPPLGVMPGYQDKTKTQEVMCNNFYHTGDVLSRHAENPQTFFFVGRKDDVFKSSGYRISPFELESQILRHPAIIEAAVVPTPHAVKGAVPKAFVVLKKGFKPNAALAKEIFDFLRGKIAESHRVQHIQFYSELLKTTSGKILRKDLKKLEESKNPLLPPQALSETFFNETGTLKPDHPPATPKMTARL